MVRSRGVNCLGLRWKFKTARVVLASDLETSLHLDDSIGCVKHCTSVSQTLQANCRPQFMHEQIHVEFIPDICLCQD